MDKLTIINMALMKCGLPLAASIEDCDWNAHLIFDNAADTVFRAACWGFATVFKVLPKDPKLPEHGFAHAYAIPEDCARVIDVRCSSQLREPRSRMVVTGRYIYTNASPCNLRYVRKVEDPNEWTPDFADAVACLIATRIAALSAEKSSLVAPLMNFYQLAVATAQTADARENAERVNLPGSIFAARGMSES